MSETTKERLRKIREKMPKGMAMGAAASLALVMPSYMKQVAKVHREYEMALHSLCSSYPNLPEKEVRYYFLKALQATFDTPGELLFRDYVYTDLTALQRFYLGELDHYPEREEVIDVEFEEVKGEEHEPHNDGNEGSSEIRVKTSNVPVRDGPMQRLPKSK